MNDLIEEIITFFYHDLWDSGLTQANILHKIILSTIICFLAFWIHKFFKKMIRKFIKNIKMRTILISTSRNIILIVSLILLLSTWVNVKNSALLILVIFVGLMAFSVKNLSDNLVAWFMLLRKKYFKLYDRIEIDGMVGDVIKVNPFYFKMAERSNDLSSSTATGRVIHVPNHMLLNHTLYNYSQLLTINWKEVKYKLTIDSDWEKALAVVEEVGEAYVEEFLEGYTEEELSNFHMRSALFDEELKLKTYVLLDDEGMNIIAQFPVHYTAGTSTQSDLNKRIIKRLNNLEDVAMNAKATHLYVDHLPK